MKRQRITSRDIDQDTQSIGRGPFTFDVAMARSNGWSEKRIIAAAEALDQLASRRLRGWGRLIVGSRKP